jgi:hypothetical protein
MTNFSNYAAILALYVALQLVWTLIIRTFPDFIGRALLKRVERKNSLELEKLKDENNQQIEELKVRLDHLRDRGVRSNEREFQAIAAAWDHFLDAYAATMQCAVSFNQHPDFQRLTDTDAKQYLDSSELSERQRDQVMSAADRNRAFSRCIEINQINAAGRAIYNARNLIGKQAIFIPDDLLASFEANMRKLSEAQIQRSMEPHYGAHSALKGVEWLVTNGEGERASLLTAIRQRIFSHER